MTNPTIGKLRGILKKYAVYCFMGSRASDFDEDKAEQAIIAWALEAVGKNEKRPYEPADRYKINNRNQLRKEIRAKLGGNSV